MENTEKTAPSNKALKTYYIPCKWESYGVITVEAENLDEAIEQSYIAPLPSVSDYLDDTFNVDRAEVKEFNRIRGIE